jgi:hypothetical protein
MMEWLVLTLGLTLILSLGGIVLAQAFALRYQAARHQGHLAEADALMGAQFQELRRARDLAAAVPGLVEERGELLAEVTRLRRSMGLEPPRGPRASVNVAN